MGDDTKEETKWCPLVYEYLLDFCYTCGLIGHMDRSCDVLLEKGAILQFSKALRFIPDKRRAGDDSWVKPLILAHSYHGGVFGGEVLVVRVAGGAVVGGVAVVQAGRRMAARLRSRC